MINEIFYMNGYGMFVWSAFIFTLMSFSSLYLITKKQFTKEKKKFISKYGTLNNQNAKIARSQSINQEILSSKQSI